jgi:choline-sulfatase
VLEATRQDAMVLFLSDHGEMSGERGLWFRMNVFEGPARLPPMIAALRPCTAPDRRGRRTPDLCPAPFDLAGVDPSGVSPLADGQGLVPPGAGGRRTTPVTMDHAAEGLVAPEGRTAAGGVDAWPRSGRPGASFRSRLDLDADACARANAADPSAATPRVRGRRCPFRRSPGHRLDKSGPAAPQ